MTFARPQALAAATVALVTAFGFIAALFPGLAIPRFLPGAIAIGACLLLLFHVRSDWAADRSRALQILGLVFAGFPALVGAAWLGARLNDGLFRLSLARYEAIAKTEPDISVGRELVPLHKAPWHLRMCCTQAEREHHANGYKELVLARFDLHGDRSYLYTLADTGSPVPSETVTVDGQVHTELATDVVIGSCHDPDLPPGWCRGHPAR